MPSIVNSLKDLVSSLLQLVWSFFTTAGALVQKTLNLVLLLFSGLVDLVVSFFHGLFELAEGLAEDLASFFLANVLMLIALGVAVFGFLQYQRNQGQTVRVGDKKLN